jgi:hypothetical protein
MAYFTESWRASEQKMIDLATAAVIAKATSDAVGAFDKMFRGFADVLRKKEPASTNIPPPDFAYVDAPEQNAFVAKSRRTGDIYQTVTYEELCDKLQGSDRQYIETLSQAMKNYEHQWNVVFEQRSMASGMEIGKLDAQLDYLVKQMADPLMKVLAFVERLGLYLDDHYHMARALTQDYLRDNAR